MTVWKWLRINVAVMLVFLLIPWFPLVWDYIGVVYWNHVDPAVTEFLTTPSQDQFVYVNPDETIVYDELVPAAVMSFGYTLPKQTNNDLYLTTGSWLRKAYVEKPRDYLVVKQGIIGRSTTGYYIIDTTKRQVFLFEDDRAWQAALSKMGIPAGVKRHSLPLRRSYEKRGWLLCQPGQ